MLHVEVEFGPVVHTRPQPPQAPGLVVNEVSHPFAVFPSQLPQPPSQTNPHVPEAQLADAACGAVAHGLSMLPSPSGLHTRDVDPLAQLEAPGVHVHGMQTPPEHPWFAGHATLLRSRPSAVQTPRVSGPAHVAVPGMHVRASHAPFRHASVEPHAVAVNPRPSALHDCRAAVEAQLAEPGAQIWVWHRPATHDDPAPQDVSTDAPPRTSHVRRRPRSRHSVTPGVQTRRTHKWSVAQYCVDGQSASERQSTQIACAMSHTCSCALHSRDERHGTGIARHAPRRHTPPEGQSTSATQSTQRPAARSHTWPGQARDDAQVVAATQRWAWHTGEGSTQSAPVMHATHTARA